MADLTKKGSLIGGVGAVLIGAAMLLFVATIILNALRDNGGNTAICGDTETSTAGSNPVLARARWNETNVTIASLSSFLTIGVILLGVLGITMVGATIMGYISGAFAA